MPDQDVLARALQGHKFGPDGSIFGPETLEDIRSRLVFKKETGCPCLESDHLNALHDLWNDDVPALLVVMEQMAAEVERLQASLGAAQKLLYGASIAPDAVDPCPDDWDTDDD